MARLATAARANGPLPTLNLSGLVSGWYRRWSQRQQLSRLDDRMLRDVGLNRSDVDNEAGKPFWAA